MKFEFTFRHMDSSVALQNFTKKKIRQEAEKFERKPLSVQITFDRRGPEQIAHCLVLGPGLDVTVQNSSEDLYAAVDGLAHKLKRQLSRHKSKKVAHHSEQFAHHNLKLA